MEKRKPGRTWGLAIMIKVNWYPTLRRHESMEKHQEINITSIAPEPAFKYFIEKYPGAEYIKCPAFSDYLKNTFIVKSPYDLVITIDKNQQTAFTDRYGQDFYDDNVKATYLNNVFLLHLPPRFLLIPETKESVMITCLPMMVEQSPLSVIPGMFDISKWTRPIECAVHIHDEKEIALKRGQPIMMFKLTAKNNDSIKLEQGVITKNILKLADACVQVKGTNPSLNLKTLYKMADVYVSKMKTIIYKEKQ